MVTSITADHQGKEKRSSLLESTGKIRAPRLGMGLPDHLPSLSWNTIRLELVRAVMAAVGSHSECLSYASLLLALTIFTLP